jgi:hypothetical protein
MKAALITFFIMGFYLFFGAFHDFVRRHGIFLYHYSVTLPTFFIMTIALFFWLRKRPVPARIPKFLDYLMVIYLAVDILMLIWGNSHRNDLSTKVSALPQDRFLPCDSCPRPDIYLLLFDEYTSSRTLKDSYYYDNSHFDSFLIQNDFHILAGSRSNYFFTPFSMASILDMSYWGNLRDPLNLTANDYIEALDPGRPSSVVRSLEQQGYAIVNNSPFDLPGHPSSLEQPFIPVKTRLITNRTLYHYLVRDIGWWFVSHFTNSKVLAESEADMTHKANRKAIESTLEDCKMAGDKPRFIYLHVFLPHGPFLFDSLGHRKNIKDVIEKEHEVDLAGYLNYIPYTNTQAELLISTIKKNTSGRAVIIFLSDHGYRYLPVTGVNEKVFFNNQNAIYYPDGDYHLLYDSISTVNEFRLVFNKMFRQKLPLLKDSTIRLRDGQN